MVLHSFSTSVVGTAAPSPLTHGSTLCRAFRNYGDEDYRASPLLAHRVKAGVTEYLVPWLDIDPKTGETSRRSSGRCPTTAR
eukprot:4662022-Prymnesium_polylepis.1